MKKYYAYKGEDDNRIFGSWEECRSYMDGRKGYTFKGFSTLAEAEAFLRGEDFYEKSIEKDLKAGYAVAYTDGSFGETENVYSYGAVVISPTGEKRVFSGVGSDLRFLSSRNIAGEVEGVICALGWAVGNGFPKIRIYHDYAGLALWATGEWNASSPIAVRYKSAYEKYARAIRCEFIKVTGHSNDKYNEQVDSVAKAALFDGKILASEKIKFFTLNGEYYSVLCDYVYAQSRAKHEEWYGGIKFTLGEERLIVAKRARRVLVSGTDGRLYALAALKAMSIEPRRAENVIEAAYGVDIEGLVYGEEGYGIKTAVALKNSSKRDDYTPYTIFALDEIYCSLAADLKTAGENFDRLSSLFRATEKGFAYKGEKYIDARDAERRYGFFYVRRINYFDQKTTAEEFDKFVSEAENFKR
ncbi:MAG: ribonuclease H family protein [Clostridia bacterium]|nr:ribonuclease H family protein [Clostridia bacterium]